MPVALATPSRPPLTPAVFRIWWLLVFGILTVRGVALGSGPRAAVDHLDYTTFKSNIATLAAFGDRSQFGAGSASYTNAAALVESRLASWGYTVERHAFTYQGNARTSLHATRVGVVSPDSMVMVSAHLDGRGGGGAADDNASGCALVLELARVLALPELASDLSIRFIFWNNEETGLNGSTAYVADRALLRGIEEPPGSGFYPEPYWVGLIQHDMILFDHGLPPQASQIPAADLDVEYQASSAQNSASLVLAERLRSGNSTYSTDYPAEVGNNMSNTDSWPFRDYAAAVSVRENRRVAEIGNGANPYWHRSTDVYSTYSEADFRLGFNAAQMTLGTVAELARTRIVGPLSVACAAPAARIRALPNLPDPFHSGTVIRFSMTEPGPVELRILDIQGRLVRILFHGELAQGEHEFLWDGTLEDAERAPAGVYVVTIATREGSVFEKLTMLP